MISESWTGRRYGMEQLVFGRWACLCMAAKRGNLPDETVGVGGQVHCLLIDRANLPVGLEPHAGTMDPGPGLAATVSNDEDHTGLVAGLRESRFEPEVNDQGNKRLQVWATGIPHAVTVDSLIPPSEETTGGHHSNTLDPTQPPWPLRTCAGKTLSSCTPTGAWASRSISADSPDASTVLKPVVFGNRAGSKEHLRPLYCCKSVVHMWVKEQAQRLGRLACSRTARENIFQLGGDSWIPDPARRKRAKEKGRGGLMAQPRPQASRRLNPRWHISIIMETTPGRNRLWMPTRATPLGTPALRRLHHPRTVPQRSQESFTMTVDGPREPRSHGRGLVLWAEGTTTDAWNSGSTICSPAGGRNPGPWTMAPGLERGAPHHGLRRDRRAPPWRRFPQPRENVRSPVTLDPSPFFCTFPRTQEI